MRRSYTAATSGALTATPMLRGAPYRGHGQPTRDATQDVDRACRNGLANGGSRDEHEQLECLAIR